MPDQDAARVDHRQRDAVVVLHQAHRFLAIVGGVERDELAVHDRLDRLLRVGEQELADAQIVDQPAGSRRRRR